MSTAQQDDVPEADIDAMVEDYVYKDAKRTVYPECGGPVGCKGMSGDHTYCSSFYV